MIGEDKISPIFLERKKKKREKENPINEAVPAIVLFVPSILE